MHLKITSYLLFQSKQMLRWYKMLTGKSYYHVPQNLGMVFEPGKLRGYFNDVTGKTLWTKEVDAEGVPVNTLYNGKKFQFPILITQKALGHWDRWLIKKDDKDKSQFLTLCNWLSAHQDESGGWDTWQVVKGEQDFKYSAMTQGQALSVLSRAFEMTNDLKFQQASKKAVNLFLRPVEENGVTCFEDNGIFLEEFPSQQRNTVLNGWIFALFGLYDYNLAWDDDRIKEMFDRSIDTLARNLSIYDSGYWSYYDDQGRLTSPFYHNLHIGQLKALCLISNNPLFKKYHQRWCLFQARFFNRAHAFVVKAYQKLKEPPSPIMK